ncbi:hypothetical protein BL250_14095 [Erwinia sp. OLTSP20]|uniref:DUF6388 family protein n=1 Tax=unclassified Erwinia TaxID=2622719 RepID=UPI000C19857C|nr:MULTISPECIES: DUF6388 family protein [unclassified Erwinia]PIJ48335.1 hypothetical protein BV501_17455 [Erwinia sp. OAMSP11]PIJ68688.1 hypothetical protein BK416_16180 [Erwinia sp. OLSSP12]PIJ78836.1 hypothetical protein BLD47_16400 [Erwinia sp. OLCASP19]PIJ79806.1 hypothetical protein BLD46_16520 [Erwinia sp. OLMTSP26]PIJ81211.1 hypothetical protein BLD49_16655 [Erwinia sp. OLMDSP33]
MKSIEEYYSIARQMFLLAYPQLAADIDALTDSDATSMGMTLAQLKTLQADRAWAAFVREKKLDGMLFAIQLAEPDKALAAQAIERYLRDHARALGVSWETFCRQNQL